MMREAPRGVVRERRHAVYAFDHGAPAGLESAQSETGQPEVRARRLAERQPFVCLSARIAPLNEEPARSHEQEDVSAQEARAEA